jgi:hypothetical protein
VIEQTLALNKLNKVLEDFILLDPKKQRWFMSALAKKADSLNRKRVTKQINLDGSKYKGRKREAKKKMFMKLKRRKNISIRIDGATATLSHKGIMGRTAYEHHYGVEIPKKHRSRSSTIGRGKRQKVKGTDRCTPEQAGILFSFVRLNEEGLEPETKVSIKEIHAASDAEKSGRKKRNAIIRLFQDAYTAAEAGHTIAKWDQFVSRKTSSRSRKYNLPSRHLLGLSSQDLPELMKYAEKRLNHYLNT